ncbi:hypothetical protein BLNAU_12881 [Blattamonas nauphoetae]|uniref:Uncharacterized protein n=1 Tax=Blattamonas nauphoetae TaxID=2049346 RepID=A0ABQ9XID6_9EUKA|nr:hypothetical protein BLNAU_12881 [Blattamonas nauphoetae]
MALNLTVVPIASQEQLLNAFADALHSFFYIRINPNTTEQTVEIDVEGSHMTMVVTYRLRPLQKAQPQALDFSYLAKLQGYLKGLQVKSIFSHPEDPQVRAMKYSTIERYYDSVTADQNYTFFSQQEIVGDRRFECRILVVKPYSPNLSPFLPRKFTSSNSPMFPLDFTKANTIAVQPIVSSALPVPSRPPPRNQPSSNPQMAAVLELIRQENIVRPSLHEKIRSPSEPGQDPVKDTLFEFAKLINNPEKAFIVPVQDIKTIPAPFEANYSVTGSDIAKGLYSQLKKASRQIVEQA